MVLIPILLPYILWVKARPYSIPAIIFAENTWFINAITVVNVNAMLHTLYTRTGLVPIASRTTADSSAGTIIRTPYSW